MCRLGGSAKSSKYMYFPNAPVLSYFSRRQRLDFPIGHARFLEAVRVFLVDSLDQVG
jgi:hypothetical protein